MINTLPLIRNDKPINQTTDPLAASLQVVSKDQL
jgi:hypothetical protein